MVQVDCDGGGVYQHQLISRLFFFALMRNEVEELNK